MMLAKNEDNTLRLLSKKSRQLRFKDLPPLCLYVLSHFAIVQTNLSSHNLISSFRLCNVSSLGDCLIDLSKECRVVLADVGLGCGLGVEDDAFTSV